MFCRAGFRPSLKLLSIYISHTPNNLYHIPKGMFDKISYNFNKISKNLI
ncbi:protein of unknown function [Candidatus Nitrosotalea okcheonensis]|uniref:Uncharacterized protein n=1 Tax=Candidatus Nitrosotalea okcheonensis TaxID=1903276 RepID=A0A2H1FD49_9ARCH|nr:protein of unknown function [Candidatus Nitrosotalea okcheonensis]